MADVVMPRLSDSMEEGTLVRWLVADGQPVARGQEIAEIETDKATMAYESDEAGSLRHTAVEGQTLPVGAIIATIGDPASPGPGDSARSPAPRATIQPVRAAELGGEVAQLSASPVARRFARAHAIRLEDVAGSGPGGRIVKADVRAHLATAPAGLDGAAVAAVAGPAPGADTPGVTLTTLSRTQEVIARRMVEASTGVPDFSVSVDVDVSELLALRATLKAAESPAPSLNDLLVKLTARVLRRHPKVNGAYRDGRFETYDRVSIGVAVATDDGLVVPTIADADRLALSELAATSRRLAEAVRARTVTPAQLSGATFTVSNLGMFGVDRFAGIINVPQAAILCVGAVAERPAVDADGGVVARPGLTLTLVCDHRILYGADAARFLADLREAIARPLLSLL